jgi:hypothetical protein
MTLHYTMKRSLSLKEKSPPNGGDFSKKLCALLSGLSLLCDLLDCLLHCLSLFCGHGGCELKVVADKSTRSRMNIFMHKRF